MLACLLYHSPSMELVARTVTLHLDTYSIIWNSRAGERRGPGPPPVGRHRSNREPCFHRGVGYVRLEEVGLIQPSALEAAIAQSGRPLAL